MGCVWFCAVIRRRKASVGGKNHVSARRNVPTKYQNRRLMRSMRDGNARKHLLYISRDDTLRVRGCLHGTLPMWRSGALGVQVRYKQGASLIVDDCTGEENLYMFV